MTRVFGTLVNLLSGWVFRKALGLDDESTTTLWNYLVGTVSPCHYASTSNQSSIRVTSQRSQMLVRKIDTYRSNIRGLFLVSLDPTPPGTICKARIRSLPEPHAPEVP